MRLCASASSPNGKPATSRLGESAVATHARRGRRHRESSSGGMQADRKSLGGSAIATLAKTRLWFPAAASVRTSDDLQEVTVWILEIEASAPAVTVDVTSRRLCRLRHIRRTR